jgi:hypothetical protein
VSNRLTWVRGPSEIAPRGYFDKAGSYTYLQFYRQSRDKKSLQARQKKVGQPQIEFGVES